MKTVFWVILPLILFTINFSYIQNVYANPFFSNGYFTENGIEWCQENLPLYEVLGEKFFEHHKHSLESRVCASLYQDYYWTYEGPDKIEKLIERSKYYSQLEILESYEESATGIIDTTPAENKDQTLLQGTTEGGEIKVQAISSAPTINQSLEINLGFLDERNHLVSNVNFGIDVIQDDKKILGDNKIFSENGLSTITTPPLTSDEPVIIKIIINGIGASENPDDWEGPRGEIIRFTVVPEFGAMATILFAITITIVIFFSSKNKILLLKKQ